MNANEIVAMKGLRLDVVRASRDCTLNGVSSKNDTLTLVGILDEAASRGRTFEYQPLDDYSRVFAAREDSPAVVLVIRRSGGVHYSLRPVGGEHEGRWYMMGGNYATGDSRFGELVGSYAAQPIHDRHES